MANTPNGEQEDLLLTDEIPQGNALTGAAHDDTTDEVDKRHFVEKWNDSFRAGVQNSHIWIQASNMAELEEAGGIDAEFNLSFERAQKDFASQGIPESWLSEVTGSFNEAHYQIKLRQLAIRADNDRVIQDGGGTGVAAFMAASIADPIGFAVDATIGMGTGKVKAGLKGIAIAGAVAGGTNAAIGYAQSSQNPDYSLNDTMIDVAAGFALGGLFAVPGARQATRELNEGLARNVPDSVDRMNGVGQPTPDRVQEAFRTERSRIGADAEATEARLGASRNEIAQLEAVHATKQAEVDGLTKKADAEKAGLEADAAARAEPGNVPKWKQQLAEAKHGLHQMTKGAKQNLTDATAIILRESPHLSRSKASKAAKQQIADRTAETNARVTELERLLGDNAGASQASQKLAGGDQSASAISAARKEVDSAKAAVDRLRADLKVEADEASLKGMHEQMGRMDFVAAKPDVSDASMMRLLSPEVAAGLTRLAPLASHVPGTPLIGGFGADTLSSARVAGYEEPGMGPLAERGNADMRDTLAQGEQDGLADMVDLGHGTWLARMRMDLSSITDKLTNPKHRVFMRKLTSSAIGVGRGEVNLAGGVEHTNQARYKLGGAFMADFNDGVRAYMGELGHSPTMAAAHAELSAKLRTEYSRRVGKYLQGADDASPAVHAGAAAVTKSSDAVWDEMGKAGVKGVSPNGKVSEPRGYMTRKVRDDIDDVLATRFATQTNGAKILSVLFERGIASALHRVGKVIDAGTTARVAAHYVEVILRKKSPSNVPGQARLLGEVKLDYIDDMLRDAGIDDAEIDRIIHGLKASAPDAAKSAVKATKERLPMDLMESVKLDDGTHFRLADIFDDNAEQLMDNYIREQSGHIGLAKVGFNDARQVDEYVATIQSELPENMKREGQAIGAIVNSILGRPIENNPMGGMQRGVRMAMDWNFLRSMGAVSWSMVAENGKVIGTIGLRTTLKMIPELQMIAKEVMTGKMDNVLSRQMAAMWAPGSAMLRGSVNLRPDDLNMPGLGGYMMGKIDKLGQIAKRAQAIASGLAPINDIQQRFLSRGFVQNLTEIATGNRNLDASFRSRMRDWGMSDEWQDKMFAHLRDNAGIDSKGVIEDLAPSKMVDGLEDQMSLMMFRMYRHAVQDLDIGATPFWMHSTLGKVVGQFRTFSMGAWTRHTLHGMAHRDKMAAAQFMWSLPFAAAAYYGRAHANYWNEPDRLEAAMDPATMARNVFAMTSDASLVPMIWDTAGAMIGMDPAFSYTRSNQLASNAWLGIPTVDLSIDMARASNTLAKAVKGEDVSEQDMQNAFGLIWLNKLHGIKQGLAVVADEFPDEYDLNQN